VGGNLFPLVGDRHKSTLKQMADFFVISDAGKNSVTIQNGAAQAWTTKTG